METQDIYEQRLLENKVRAVKSQKKYHKASVAFTIIATLSILFSGVLRIGGAAYANATTESLGDRLTQDDEAITYAAKYNLQNDNDFINNLISRQKYQQRQVITSDPDSMECFVEEFKEQNNNLNKIYEKHQLMAETEHTLAEIPFIQASTICMISSLLSATGLAITHNKKQRVSEYISKCNRAIENYNSSQEIDEDTMDA